MLSTQSYVLKPIPNDAAERFRATGGEVYVADSNPGYPCRQCLRDADIGEELILVSHDPFDGDSPYRSASPIFIHRETCTIDVVAANERLPDQLTIRQLSVRSFDSDEMMIAASVIDGGDLEAMIERFFADPNSTHLHVHNAERGCWAVAIERP